MYEREPTLLAVQAEKQLPGGWTLMRGGTPGCPEPADWLASNTEPHARIGIDPFLHTVCLPRAGALKQGALSCGILCGTDPSAERGQAMLALKQSLFAQWDSPSLPLQHRHCLEALAVRVIGDICHPNTDLSGPCCCDM